MTEQEIVGAVKTLPQSVRDRLAIQLISEYLDRGAHFYNHFARKLSAACILSDNDCPPNKDFTCAGCGVTAVKVSEYDLPKDWLAIPVPVPGQPESRCEIGVCSEACISIGIEKTKKMFENDEFLVK